MMQAAGLPGECEPPTGVTSIADTPTDWSAAPSVPVVMECVLAVRTIDCFNTHTETMVFRASLEIYWTDPRLVGRTLEEGVPPEIWRPRITACMGLKMPKAEAYEEVPVFFKKERQSDGRLKMITPMSFGEGGWNLNDDLSRLRVFPFDGARVDLTVLFSGARKDTGDDVQVSLQRANVPSRVEKF